MKMHRILVAAVTILGFGMSIAVATAASAPRRTSAMRHRRSSRLLRVHRASGAADAPLVFGIYPGGAAGAVGPSGHVVPEDPGKRLATLEELRAPGRPFVLHLYASYSGSHGPSARDQIGTDIAQYTAAGFEIELVLAYRPADGGSDADVAGFAGFVRNAVDAFGSNHEVVSLQVTNEANVGGAPNASDGYYAGAKDALVAGVIAASKAIQAGAFHQVKVGFNWAYETAPSEPAFWSYLGQHGGSAFIAALDWVGLDIYPGTWGPPARGDITVETKAIILDALRRLRSTYMPLAGIPASVPLHISENGYPTGPGRSDAMQVAAMTAAITTIDAARHGYNVTDYRWFDLRDADSSSRSFEDQYGLLRDDYAPKPAFEVYRQLITRLSLPHPAARVAARYAVHGRRSGRWRRRRR